jgi:type I restriction enzyme S subunit
MTERMDVAKCTIVPEGWTLTQMSALGELICGTSPSSATVNKVGKGTPYVSGPEQWDGFTLHLDKWTTSPRRVVPDGCIFVTVKGAGVGKLFPGQSVAIGRDIYAFKSHPGIDRRLVQHALQFTIFDLVRQAKGDIPGLSKPHILEHAITLPPEHEQVRIADRIDELFTDLDAGIAALERTRRKLKRYRSAVLHAAVTGKLTAEWRKSHGPPAEPGDQLLARILRERRAQWEARTLAKYEADGRTPPNNWHARYVEPIPPKAVDPRELPSGWGWAMLDQVAFVSSGTTPRRDVSAYWQHGSVPWINSAAVNNPFVDEPSELVTETALADTALKLYEPGTLLMALYGEGKTRGKVTELRISATINQALAAICWFDRSRELKDYVKVSLLSMYHALRRESAGGVQPNLNVGLVSSTVIPLPPLNEQRAIVAVASEKLSQIDAMEAEVERGIARASRLRQAILKSAFAGKLVPQDPSDEPASMLLERIRAERAAMATGSTPKRPRKKAAKKSAKKTPPRKKAKKA